MSVREIILGLAHSVFRYLYADGRATIDDGLTILAEGLSFIAARVSDWLYINGYMDWSNRVRLVNRYLFNTLKISAYVLSAWQTVETVSRVNVDGLNVDYIE